MMPINTPSSSIALGTGGHAPGSRVLRFLNCSRNFFIGSLAFGRGGLGCGLTRFAGSFALGLLQAHVHDEFGNALVAYEHGFDLDQIRVLKVRRRREIAHQRRDSRVGLRVAHHVDFQAGLLDRLEVDAIGYLLNQLLQHINGLGTVCLQALDDLLAREQSRDLGFELFDLLNLLVEPDVLPFEEFIAVALHGDISRNGQVHGPDDQKPEHGHHASQHAKMLALGLAARLAPREQIDANHGSNLRMASPQATISEGASATSFFSETRGEIAMLAKGLATSALIWVRLCTISSSPGITAEPPVSRTCSTEVYWVDVKKNCTARWISNAAFSMKGRSTSDS